MSIIKDSRRHNPQDVERDINPSNIARDNVLNFEFDPVEIQKKITTSVFFIAGDLTLPHIIKAIDINNLLDQIISQRAFKAKKNETLECTLNTKDGNIFHSILVGIGELSTMSPYDIKSCLSTVYPLLEKTKIPHATLYLDSDIFTLESCIDICAFLHMEAYKFTKYFKETAHKHEIYLKSATICTRHHKSLADFYNNYKHTLDGATLTRDLVSEPPNVIFPRTFKDKCEELEKLQVKVTVLDELEMLHHGMNALLAVAQGSAHKPYTVIMEWNGLPDSDIKREPLVIVGKGVTFDTGGINIKPKPTNMKSDMAGAAAVLGVMYALAKSKAKVNVVGAVGLVENMPSGHAYRPDDVLVSMSKKTIEIDNTDAEGRLVLADVLWYIQTHYTPKAIVDLATLTGAISVALGDYHAGLFTNDDLLGKKLIQAGLKTQELLWQMPLADYYDKMNDSHIADIKNCAPEAGSITAAQFLQRFIKKGTPWAHLDIAGVAFKDKYSSSTSIKRATGFGVMLLRKFIQDNYETSSTK